MGLIIIIIKDTPLFLIFYLFFIFFVVISTTMDQPARQPRISRPTAKLIDANNLKRAPLAYQHNAIAAENACVEASSSHAVSVVPNSLLPQSIPPIAPSSPVSTCQPSPSNNSETYQSVSTASKHPIIHSDDEEALNSGRKQKRRKKSSSEHPSSKH